MSPLRAISASTRISARVIGRGRDLGTIEPGKLADITVIKGNPLFDIQSLADVEIVVKDGVDVLVARAVTAQTGEIVEFAALWTRRQTTELSDGVRVNIPTIDDLILTKRFALRPKDVEDIRLLEILKSEAKS
jgi:adenine deaminase